MDLLGLLLPSGRALSAQHRRDATVAIVGFTSWSAVAWKLSRSAESPEEAAQASLAAAATLLCLWPLALGLLSSESYAWWREWLIPTHLAAQHWIGLHFSLLPGTQHQAMAAPGWTRGRAPVFLASFCQPWLYLAFGACLQRTRLRNFLWTQPLLLAPMLWMGRAHCSAQLAAAPEAATHVRRIVAALQRCSLWLPMQPLQDAVATGAAAAGAAAAGQLAADDGRTACVAVHFWLVLILAFCLPAIVIHRLEGAEQQAQEERKARQPAARGADGAPRPGDKARGMLLQRRTPVVDSAIEFALAAYVAWLVVQLAVPMLT